MITELYGLPASGKSTLARKMSKQGYTVVIINNRKELLFYNFLFLVKRPIKFFVTLLYIIINFGNIKLFYYKFMNVFLDKNAKYEKALKYEKAIIDQGHFQNIISLFEKKITVKKMTRYLNFLPFPDKLIIFNLDNKERIIRANKRGYLSREEYGREYQKKWRNIVEYNDKLFIQNLKNFPINYFIKR